MKINNNPILDNFIADKSWLHRLDVGEEVDAYFTSRGMDADASNPYSGFNVCHYSGDDPLMWQIAVGCFARLWGLRRIH